MNKTELLYKEIISAFTDRSFLQTAGLDRAGIMAREAELNSLAEDILSKADSEGRIRSTDILDAASLIIPEMRTAPPEGWAVHCYRTVLHRIFPHLEGSMDNKSFSNGRIFALVLLRAVFSYERKVCRFDPTFDFPLLTDAEMQAEAYTAEYTKMHRLARSAFIYEFMRIGSETTPFNTLGHVAGVHYIALYMARQLKTADVPVDLALISGAAASHDIGKYGCRKSEEYRVPYLHYYYTDYCMTGNGMPAIAGIAANHSTWDLEFDNLSVESLLLIYADFRVKSTRDPDGKEIIHFYTLAEAFDVILGKLDNVDDAKRHRYEKVYARLKDFEDYMIEHGAVTDMPEEFALKEGVITSLPENGEGFRTDKPVRVKPQLSLTHGAEIAEQLKMKALDHNIHLMHYFSSKNEFVRLIETARGESDWKNLRTYINILGDYSTYMSEGQKALTLKFLYDQLTHRESDVREQAAHQIGQIVASFRQAYKKELPEDIPRMDETITNLEMFETYLSRITSPSSKLTTQHRQWIIQSMDFFVKAALDTCAPQFIPRYLDIVGRYYEDQVYDDYTIQSVLHTPIAIDKDKCTEEFVNKVTGFAERAIGTYSENIDLLALDVLERFRGDDDGSIRSRRSTLLGIGSQPAIGSGTEELLSSMFLDDLKYQTLWIRKTANIRYMADISENVESNVRMHIATHFVNLIKRSETVTVRREAGISLIKLMQSMPDDQRNEIMVELYNGLEIEDYQFARLIPEYLGIIILLLPSDEFDEVISELEGHINTGNVRTASASLFTLSIALENYSTYRDWETEDIRSSNLVKITGLLMKGLAHFDESISQEAFRAFGERIFSGSVMTPEEKRSVLETAGKRVLTLIPDSTGETSALSFYNNASTLKSIYRFISMYQTDIGMLSFESSNRVAFFPGSFDPFSLGHRAIAHTIRDMGFEVYLALDEFSWSKKTLPHMMRREIISMSIAAEADVYIFPDDCPVNISNPGDLAKLKKMFAGRELYIAVGSDVIINASAYKAKPVRDSIHSFNHIIFAREARHRQDNMESTYPVTGEVINLTLKKYYEDISSSRIRENIDLGRDISHLIDPVAQNYIYENNLYVRQPAYKHEIQARDIHISSYEHRNYMAVSRLKNELTDRGFDYDALMRSISKPHAKTVYIASDDADGSIHAFASAKRVDRRDLLREFGDTAVTEYIRAKATGAIAVIGAFYMGKTRSISNLGQIILIELMTSLLAEDYGYVVYHPSDPAGMSQAFVDILRRQGFVNISQDHDNPVYAVDATAPVIIFRDVETVIKAPLDKNPRVRKAVDEAHSKLLHTFCELYPGRLLLSFNTSAVYSKIVDMVAAENGVSTIPDPMRRRGPYMAVPFGKALSDVVVPNTVTKALRTEKYVNENVRGFSIRESYGYSDLHTQIETLKSFGREVILIDDLLHSGQRMKRIDPLLREHDVKVRKVIVGLLTGNARDEMIVRDRATEGAYFIPSIKFWLNERDCYPFIGGDSLDTDTEEATSINIIMPYTSFSFISSNDSDMTYKYSLTCLENARDVMKAIEQEYQAKFEKQLTLGRLGAVITHPRRPDYGRGLKFDENVAPSVYIESDIKRLKRLHLTR